MIHVVIIVVIADDNLQELRDIYAQEAAQFRLKVDAVKAASPFTASCGCGWTNHYTTPGRAKMGLSGHQRWCKR